MAVITGKEGLLSFKHGIFRYSIGELERTRPSSWFRVGSGRETERNATLFTGAGRVPATERTSNSKQTCTPFLWAQSALVAAAVGGGEP